MHGEYTVTVQVWGHSYEISVHQKSKAVWVARGEYMGKQIETKVQTQGAAIILWCRTAQYRGNDG